MDYKTVIDGGVMYTPVIAQKQIVYLDFDGEFTCYNGEILSVDGVEVQNSNLTADRIASIVEALNTGYAVQNVVFVTEKPLSGEYSTIYIGKTDAFNQYGNFAGLAETIDENNQNRSDNAFVLLDSSSDNNTIIKTISHETDHLLGTLNHGGEGINAYAYDYYVYSGETATGVVLRYDSMYVFSGGVANSTTVDYCGNLFVSSGGVANSTTVNYWGNLYVFSGGVANSTTVYSYSNLFVSSGGVANSTTVNYGGDLDVCSGGTATNITAASGADLHLTVAPDTYWNGTFHGSAFEMKNAAITGYTVNYAGSLRVSSGGVANRTTVNSGGDLYVSSGGVANRTTVNSWGTLDVCSGGTATNITAATGADLHLTVAPDTYWNGTFHGSAFEMKNAAITGYTVNSGYLYVSSGGVANSTTVNNRGYLSVSSGGVANSTTVNYWGYLHVSSGGVANSTTVNSCGYLYVSSGGVANSTTVNSYGDLYVFSGGTATNVIWTPCVGTVSAYDGAYVTYASSYSGVYYGSAGQLLSSAQKMDNNVVAGYASMYIMDNGVANSTTVNSGGYLSVSSGGVANSTTVNYGSLWVSSGGVANSTTVNSSGYLRVDSGGVANSTTVNDWSDLYVSSGGVANSTTVNFSGSLHVSSGGVANSTTMNFSGSLHVSSGGIANSTTVNSGGSLWVSSGGTATAIKENGGYVSVADGANVTFVANTFSGLVLSSYQSATLHSGTTANSTTVNDGGWLYVSSGGVANSTTMNGGILCISSGGVANSTTVNSSGYLSVSSGGVANSTTVNEWGDLDVWGGGILRGSLQIKSGAVVFAYAGAVIDFTIADRKPVESYLVNDLSRISGNPVYSITVSENQALGEYKLAQGAENFSGTLSIGTQTENYGSISVNGEVFSYNGIDYLLKQESGNLTLTVRDLLTISGNTESWTNQNVSISAVAEAASGIRSLRYSLDSGKTWNNYTDAVVMSKNGWVHFRAIDNAGNVTTKGVLVNKIDKVAPVITFSGNPANYAKKATISMTAKESTSGIKSLLYSLDSGKTWNNYTAGVVMQKNGWVHFRAIDNAGNISTKGVLVNKIDRYAPVLTISGNAASYTRNDVTISAVAQDGTSGIKSLLYSLDSGKTWNNYTAGVVMQKNGWVHFRAIDNAGNMSTKGVLVNKIDKTAPTIQISGLPAEYTKTVTITGKAVDNGSGLKSLLYSLDSGKTWQTYTDGVTFTKNGWIHFRATDNLGNVNTKGILVNKIDKTAPVLQLNTSGNKVSAVSTDKESGLAAFEYSFDGETWVATANHKAVTLKNGDSVTFRAVDKVGNVTEKQYDYNIIDYNALKSCDTLAASDLTGNNPESDIMKGLLA